MPRLVLVDDDGREMFSGQVSRANVERTAAFLRKNMATIQMIARAKQAVTTVVDAFDQVGRLNSVLVSAPRPPRRKARR